MSKESIHRRRQQAAARTTKTDDDPREKVYKTSRTLPMPTRKQKSDLIADSLKRKRRHRKKWKVPQDAEAIMDMHFAVHSHNRKSFHAEMTLEIPQDETMTLFYTISATMPTEALALRRVIETMEHQKWFIYFRQRGVRFRVTGVLEELYHGYL